MLHFDFSHSKELKDFLYNEFTHDAKIKKMAYEYLENKLYIEAYHEFFDVKTIYSIHNITMFVLEKGDWGGVRDSIFSLTVEKKSYFPYRDERKEQRKEDFLYLLLQTFSGDEIHVAAKEVDVEVFRKENCF